MKSKFSFTQEDLDNMMTEELGREPMKDKTAKPNLLEQLKAKARLNKGNERTQ